MNTNCVRYTNLRLREILEVSAAVISTCNYEIIVNDSKSEKVKVLL